MLKVIKIMFKQHQENHHQSHWPQNLFIRRKFWPVLDVLKSPPSSTSATRRRGSRAFPPVFDPGPQGTSVQNLFEIPPRVSIFMRNTHTYKLTSSFNL